MKTSVVTDRCAHIYVYFYSILCIFPPFHPGRGVSTDRAGEVFFIPTLVGVHARRSGAHDRVSGV